MKLDAILFDLDGTLLDSIGDIASCANEALAAMGLPLLTVDAYKALVGDGISGLARKALPLDSRNEASIETFVEIYRGLYAEKWSETTVPYPGIEGVLSTLHARGIRLAVLSNKRDDFTNVCVERLLPRKLFDVIRGESEITPRKPDPQGALQVARDLGVSPARCLFVGDSEIDAETAQRAGMEFLAVEWGYRSQAELAQAGAKHFAKAAVHILDYV